MAKAKAKKVAPKAAPEVPKGVEMEFKIADISSDPELQPRKGDGKGKHGIYTDHVNDLREAIRKPETRAEIPRVHIWRVAGRGNYITDGHHTTEAYTLEGKKTVPALVFEGTWLDAVKDANVRANDHKALKYNNDEKRQKVTNLVKALKKEGLNWSANRIAKECKVSHDLATDVLEKHGGKSDKVQGADGKTYQGKKAPKPAESPKPEGEKGADPTPVASPPLPTTLPAPSTTGVAAVASPSPAATAKPTNGTEPPRTFDFLAFEGKVGAVDREIDNLARMFGVMNSPRTEGIRKALRNFKDAFTEWHRELGEKAKQKL